jgi:hypothetical protein
LTPSQGAGSLGGYFCKYERVIVYPIMTIDLQQLGQRGDPGRDASLLSITRVA